MSSWKRSASPAMIRVMSSFSRSTVACMNMYRAPFGLFCLSGDVPKGYRNFSSDWKSLTGIRGPGMRTADALLFKKPCQSGGSPGVRSISVAGVVSIERVIHRPLKALGSTGPRRKEQSREGSSPMKEKVVFITGANGGLGTSVTRAFLQKGAKVIGSSLRITAADFPEPNFEAMAIDFNKLDE